MSTITVSSPQAACGRAAAEGDVTGAPSSEMSERAELESIIELLSPIILPDGQLYCHLRAGGQKGGQVVRLDDKRAKNMVIYLYDRKHGKRQPQPAQLRAAISSVHGRLLCERPPLTENTLVSAIVAVAHEHESWCGSASDLLDLIAESVRHNSDIDDAQLPKNERSLGIQLGKIQAELTAYGIALCRPARRDSKRLWAWQLFMFDNDMSDMSKTQTSETNPKHGKDLAMSDTLSEEQKQLNKTYREEKTL